MLKGHKTNQLVKARNLQLHASWPSSEANKLQQAYCGCCRSTMRLLRGSGWAREPSLTMPDTSRPWCSPVLKGCMIPYRYYEIKVRHRQGWLLAVQGQVGPSYDFPPEQNESQTGCSGTGAKTLASEQGTRAIPMRLRKDYFISGTPWYSVQAFGSVCKESVVH